MREDANSLLPPIFREIVANTESPFLQPIVEYQCEKMVFGRTILIGDAAFTLRPHIGLGVSEAAGDAATLAQAFGDGERIVDHKLETWEAARIRFGQAAQNAKQRELSAHYRQADVVLDGIAAADPYRHLDL